MSGGSTVLETDTCPPKKQRPRELRVLGGLWAEDLCLPPGAAPHSALSSRLPLTLPQSCRPGRGQEVAPWGRSSSPQLGPPPLLATAAAVGRGRGSLEPIDWKLFAVRSRKWRGALHSETLPVPPNLFSPPPANSGPGTQLEQSLPPPPLPSFLPVLPWCGHTCHFLCQQNDGECTSQGVGPGAPRCHLYVGPKE